MHRAKPVLSINIVCTNNLRALIAAWLNASQRSRYGVCLNGSARE